MAEQKSKHSNSGGRKKPPITKEQLMAAIAKSHGIRANVAKQLNRDTLTVRKYIEKYGEEAEQAMRQAADAVTDIAEDRLIQQIKAGERWAIKFWLSTRGKHRGFTERQEITGADGESLDIEVQFVRGGDAESED